MTDKYDKFILIIVFISVVLWFSMIITSISRDHRTQLYKKYPECATACKPHVCVRYKKRTK